MVDAEGEQLSNYTLATPFNDSHPDIAVGKDGGPFILVMDVVTFPNKPTVTASWFVNSSGTPNPTGYLFSIEDNMNHRKY